MGIRQDVKDIRRLEEILSTVVKYEMGNIIHTLKLKHLVSMQHRMKKDNFDDPKPVKVRKAMEELGGAFLKLGQLLSLRPDLISLEYCNELKKLQDNVPAFKGADTIIKNTLGKKIAHCSNRPLASASVSQVHEAILRNNDKIAIKVRRPDIVSIFETDIDILHKFAVLLEHTYGTNIIEPVKIVEEFKTYTEQELDFTKEAANIELFFKHFKDNKEVIIPRVYKELSDENILCMEYIRGTNISKVRKHKKTLAKKLAHLVFTQIFEYGIFHADPHPGNIFVLNEKIALLDFGIVGRIDARTKDKLAYLFMNLIQGNPDEVTDALIKLNFSKKVDKKQLSDDLRMYLKEFYDQDLGKIPLSKLIHNCMIIARKNNLHLPTDFVLLGKSIVTIEGVCRELDPEFNIIHEFKPYITPKKTLIQMVKKFKSTFMTLPYKTEQFIDDFALAEKSMKEIDTDLKDLNTNINRSVDIIALMLLSMGFLISSVVMMPYGKKIFLDMPLLPLIGFGISFVLLILLLIQIHKQKIYK